MCSGDSVQNGFCGARGLLRILVSVHIRPKPLQVSFGMTPGWEIPRGVWPDKKIYELFCQRSFSSESFAGFEHPVSGQVFISSWRCAVEQPCHCVFVINVVIVFRVVVLIPHHYSWAAWCQFREHLRVGLPMLANLWIIFSRVIWSLCKPALENISRNGPFFGCCFCTRKHFKKFCCLAFRSANHRGRSGAHQWPGGAEVPDAVWLRMRHVRRSSHRTDAVQADTQVPTDDAFHARFTEWQNADELPTSAVKVINSGCWKTSKINNK